MSAVILRIANKKGLMRDQLNLLILLLRQPDCTFNHLLSCGCLYMIITLLNRVRKKRGIYSIGFFYCVWHAISYTVALLECIPWYLKVAYMYIQVIICPCTKLYPNMSSRLGVKEWHTEKFSVRVFKLYFKGKHIIEILIKIALMVEKLFKVI